MLVKAAHAPLTAGATIFRMWAKAAYAPLTVRVSGFGGGTSARCTQTPVFPVYILRVVRHSESPRFFRVPIRSTLYNRGSQECYIACKDLGFFYRRKNLTHTLNLVPQNRVRHNSYTDC